MVAGVALDGFIEAVVGEIAKQVRAEIRTLPQVRPHSWHQLACACGIVSAGSYPLSGQHRRLPLFK
jgi:hypothetical protein